MLTPWDTEKQTGETGETGEVMCKHGLVAEYCYTCNYPVYRVPILHPEAKTNPPKLKS